jgi:antitoxin component YwqK of YwqJK toxin-antitoxin module
MKSILFSLFLLLFATVSNAQKNDDVAIYLDSLHQPSDELNHKYVRIIKDYNSNQDSYSFFEYYKSGKMASRGTTKDKYKVVPFGAYLSYYENGNKRQASNYDDFGINGKQFAWYENGNFKFEKEIVFDKKTQMTTTRILNYVDENNVRKVADGNGFFEEKEEGRGETSKGFVKNGFKDGVWEGLFMRLKCRYTETYNEGKLISGESFDENNISYKYSQQQTEPASKSGTQGFYKYIARNYRIPNVPGGIKGKVYITFVVDKEGKIIEPKVLRDMGHGTGEEAIRVLTNSPKWAPGVLRGQKVRCTYSFANYNSG